MQHILAFFQQKTYIFKSLIESHQRLVVWSIVGIVISFSSISGLVLYTTLRHPNDTNGVSHKSVTHVLQPTDTTASVTIGDKIVVAQAKLYTGFELSTYSDNPQLIKTATGSSLVFTAVQPGQTDIYIFENAICQPKHVCLPMTVTAFKAHVTVKK